MTLVLSPPDRAGLRDGLAGLLDQAAGGELSTTSDGAGAGRIAAAVLAAESLLGERRPTAIVLCGEGPEVAATALVAVKLGIPQARIGAGSRVGDRHDPGEIDRRIADRLCDLLMCEDDAALANLRAEGLAANAVVVGDASRDPDRAAAAIRDWLAAGATVD
jgi:UDP-N-acetylglucosamine 2-epimerase (non-hydrolysing)